MIRCFRHFTIALFSFKFRFLFQRLNFIKCNKYFELWIVLLVLKNIWNTAKCHVNYIFFVIRCFRHFTIILFSFKFRFLFQRLNFIKCNKYSELWIVLLVLKNIWNTAKCHVNYTHTHLFYDMYVLRLNIGEMFPWHYSCVVSYGLEIWVMTIVFLPW